MNNLIFKKIILDSFLSYDHEELDINQSGVVFIKGENNQESKSDSNGSGKSALISESLLWCLTGFTSRSADEVKNLYLDRGAAVSVYLEKNGIDYIITRGTHNSIANNGLTIIKNGENVTKARISDTKEWFEIEFPELSWSVLTSIVILSQGLVGGLSNMVNRDRKAKLEELSKTDITYNKIKSLVESIEDRFNANLNILKNTSRETSFKKQVNVDLIDSLNKTIEEIENKNKAKITDSLIEEEITRLINQSVEADTQKTQYEILLNELSPLVLQYKTEITRLNLESQMRMTEYNQLVTKLSLKQAEKTKYEAEFNKLEHELSHVVDQECPTCHQIVNKQFTEDLKSKLLITKTELLNLISAADIEIGSLKEKTQQLNTTNGTVSAKVRELQHQLDEKQKIVDLYNSEIKQLYTKILSLNAQQLALSNAKNAAPESTNAYKSKIVSILDENKVLESQLNSTLRAQAEVEQQLSIAKWFTSQTSKAIRSYLLEGVIDYLNMRCKEYSEYLFDTDVVYLKSDGSSLDIFLGNKKIENCSGGEHRRADIVLQLAIRDLVINEAGFSSNLLIIDEVFDHLDSVGMSAVLDLITSQKQNINSIFLITHKSDADIDFDDVLTVKKENNISRVVQ